MDPAEREAAPAGRRPVPPVDDERLWTRAGREATIESTIRSRRWSPMA